MYMLHSHGEESTEIFINYICIVTYLIVYYPIHTLPFATAEYTYNIISHHYVQIRIMDRVREFPW